MRIATIRKAIACGAGFIVAGLLEWAVQATDLEPWLEQLVPAPLVPIVPIVLGGIAATGAVYRAANTPVGGASAVSPTIPEASVPAVPSPPEAVQASTGTDARPVSSSAPFWQGVAPGEPVAATSMVELLPAPTRASYQ